jgi:PKD repeat protein
MDGDNNGSAICDMGAYEAVYVPVENHPPIADAGGPYVADEGSSIHFDGSASSDPDSDPLQYRWDFNGDGAWDTEWSGSPTASSTWNDEYSGTVTLEVRDSELAVDTDYAAVTILNAPPVANTAAPYTGNEGAVRDNITFIGSFTDQGLLDTHTAPWDFGDGTTGEGTVIEETNTVTRSHSYKKEGTYTVILTVTDSDRGVSSDTLQVTIQKPPKDGKN